MAQMQYDDEDRFSKFGTKSPAISLASRVTTLVSLVISVVVLTNINVKVSDQYQTSNSWKNYRSYSYMFYVMVIASVYSAVQLPFAAYYMKTKKHLINNILFLKFDFIADLVLVYFLSSAGGAGFGMTLDSKRYIWLGDGSKEMESYFDKALIPDSFLFLGSVFSVVSLYYSAMALSKN